MTGILDGQVSFRGSFLEFETQQADTLFVNTNGQATPGNRDVSVGLRRRSWLWTLQDFQGACDLCWVLRLITVTLVGDEGMVDFLVVPVCSRLKQNSDV